MTPQELKNSILQMAIQGKLVEQRLEEGTAEELYQQIQAEKQRLIAEKKIKNDKPLPEITDDEKPFDIPDSWKWVRLRDIVYNRGQMVPSERFAYIDIGSIDNKKQQLNSEDNIIEPDKAPSRARKLVALGDILYSTVRPYLHNMCIVNRNFSATPIASTGFAAMVCHSGVYNQYLFRYLMSPAFDAYANNTENAKGVAYPAINDTRLYLAVIPLPPLAEQKRIVAKIEELLPLIDRYEAAWTKLEAFNKRFPEDMQKSILQEAIQGKLVEQRPEEGTGEELYQQIQAEKQRLIAEKKIKKDKPLPEITDDEKPFDIPESWKWCRIGEIFTVIRGSSPRPKGSSLYWASNETQFNWVTIKDITAFCENGVLYGTHEYLTEMGASKSTYVSKGELVIAVSGSTTGKFCILGIDGYIYDGLAAVLNPTKIISYAYLKVFFSWIYDRLNAKKVGSAFPNINTDMLKNTLFPLPPLAEQKRIVAKIDQLLPLCERLK